MRKLFPFFANRWFWVVLVVTSAALLCLIPVYDSYSAKVTAEDQARWIARYYAEVKSGETQAGGLIDKVNRERRLALDAGEWKILEEGIFEGNSKGIVAYRTESIDGEYIVVRTDLSIDWIEQAPAKMVELEY